MTDELQLPDGMGMKALSDVTIADEGKVTAVIATVDVVDNDGEVIPSGAIPDGMKVTVSAYNHDTVFNKMMGVAAPDAPPVGKGVIRIEGKRAVAYMDYFMETTRGKEAFLTIKAMGADQPWSFAYHETQVDRPNAEWAAKGARRVLTKLGPLLDGAMEASPVKMPGGKNTKTLAVKQADTVEPPPEPKAEVDTAFEERIARVKRQIGR